MTLSAVLAVIWVLASTTIAFLPMRMQIPPGIVLLICAPVLIVWLGYDYGWFLSFLAFVGFVSMFRNPLRHLWGRITGREVAE